MDVFVIPIGHERYELYCEQAPPDDADDSAVPVGTLGKLRHRFSEMLKAAERRQAEEPSDEPKGWATRAQERMMAWVAERIAEQRLLWNLRRETAVVAAHPQDMTFEQVHTLVRRILQRDYDRHRWWLIVDSIGFLLSVPLTLIPGPNVVQYYFVFRLVGHWLSMRGARQGLDGVAWTGRPCQPLGELRAIAALEPAARDERLHEIAAELRLPHLSTFFARVAA